MLSCIGMLMTQLLELEPLYQKLFKSWMQVLIRHYINVSKRLMPIRM